ncbi:hypothetical protein RS694_05405 [Rhodoferax saidenbachensis]|uniref:Uncharacterized protein n=2 Tax=Rhodoferax saidenbachensis TaxID=1484693 RepID=A0A1P8K7P6_9BURK|nr:hypothetical protein RS694_05405 [Rhodoferax saidenbachensis]
MSMTETIRKRRKFDPSNYLKAGERYEQHYAAFGVVPYMSGIDIFLSIKNREDLNNLVTAARRQEENEEMCIDMRALAIVSLEGRDVVFTDQLVAFCKKSGKSWFQFELNGQHIKTDWELNFDIGARSAMENPFKSRTNLH